MCTGLVRPENARVGRGRSRWSTFLGKAVRVLAERRAVSGARDMFVLSAARSLGRDTRESGKRSNELQNCNTITAMTRNADSPRLTHTHRVTSRTIARSRSRTNRQFILKLQHLEKLAQLSIGPSIIFFLSFVLNRAID